MSDRGHGKGRVVYVDSDESAQETVTACLDDYTVTTAHTVDAGIEAALAEGIDCVVTEHTLPDGTGFDVLSACNQARPNLPVVFYTADGSEKLASEAFAAGADGYHPKAEDPDCRVLRERIDAAIERRTLKPTALDRMTDAFYVLDEEWRITYINERAEQIVREAMDPGKRADTETLRGSRLWDLVPEAVETTIYEKYHESMERQEAVNFEEYYEPLDRWFEIRAYPSASGLSVYFQDITERKTDQRELERREAVLTEMYRVVADKGRSFEEKVDELLSIGRKELNAKYGSLSRIDGSDYIFEVVQSSADDAPSSGDIVPLSWTSCERAVKTKKTLVIADMEEKGPELAQRDGNREIGIQCYLGAPIEVDGKVTGTFCFYHDQPREEAFSQWEVTLVELMGSWISYERERKRRERELTRERNRVEEFASMVSHDLRSPLSVANARLELASDECDSVHLDDIAGALDRMEELIEDMLALARMGKQIVDSEPVEFRSVVQEAWGTTSSGPGELIVEEGIDTIVADDSRLRQLFENLFRNSVEHGSTGNRTASDDSVEHGSEDGDVTIRVGPLDGVNGFYVEDDGPGIPEDERDQVFESGYTTERDGTGFGLNIVTEIVEAHGGEITLTESESGGVSDEGDESEARQRENAGGARFEIRGIETR